MDNDFLESCGAMECDYRVLLWLKHMMVLFMHVRWRKREKTRGENHRYWSKEEVKEVGAVLKISWPTEVMTLVKLKYC